jgi:hypothetical protein
LIARPEASHLLDKKRFAKFRHYFGEAFRTLKHSECKTEKRKMYFTKCFKDLAVELGINSEDCPSDN